MRYTFSVSSYDDPALEDEIALALDARSSLSFRKRGAAPSPPHAPKQESPSKRKALKLAAIVLIVLGAAALLCVMTLPQRPLLGYLPNGSTNDFAASLHLSSDPRHAAQAIASGQPHALDIGRHNDRYFAYVASFGAFTRSSYSASQAAKNALGHFAYILEGLGDLDSLRPYNCRIEADGETFEGDFIFGAVCNSTSLGGLVKLDPSRVKMDDGLFELLLLRMPKTPLDLQNLITAMTRMQYEYPGVIFRHVQHVTLTTQAHIPWSLDGEFAPSVERVDIDNLSGAVELLR